MFTAAFCEQTDVFGRHSLMSGADPSPGKDGANSVGSSSNFPIQIELVTGMQNWSGELSQPLQKFRIFLRAPEAILICINRSLL